MADMTTMEIIAGMEDITQTGQRRFMTEQPQLIGGNKGIGNGLFDQLVKREHKQLSGLALPWPHVNERISGLGEGTATLWVAPTGTGKTAAMNNIMNKTCYDDGLHALNIGVEMPPEIMMLRQVACRSNVTERDLRLNKNWHVSEKSRGQVQKACAEMDALDTYHYLFMPEFSISKIRGHAIRAKSQWDIKLLIFDYISEPEDATNKKQEWQNLSQLMWRLAVLARSLMIPVVVCGQTVLIVSRDYMTLDDIALAKYMSHHADVVIGQINKTASCIQTEADYKDAPGNMGNQKLYILKARHGGDDPAGMKHRYINLNYNRPTIRINEGLYPCYEKQTTL
jgi:replicative DNA helicase